MCDCIDYTHLPSAVKLDQTNIILTKVSSKGNILHY